MTDVSVQPAQDKIRLAEILGALSYALDMVEGQPAGHCVRCCYIGTQIGRRMGLPQQALWELYYSLLAKDVGCSSNAARICEIYLVDDIAFKRDYKTVSGSLPQVLRFVMTHTGMQAGLAERFRALVNVFQNGGDIAQELMESRCDRGAEIARKMRFSESVVAGIRSLDEHWDGSGRPERLSGEAIPLFSRIALVAQIVDVFQTSAGPEAARQEVRHRAGTWLDPQVAAAFDKVADDEAFWQVLRGDELQAAMFALEPGQQTTFIDENYLDDIAAAFAQVIDSKSPYTSGHSERVTLFADMIAEELRLAPERRRWLRRAALLHDIGKLGVSNTILDKPDKLDDGEWVSMRQHTTLGRKILSRIAAFRDIAEIAGSHHEKLDGTGYPDGLKAERLALEVRIVTVADIFDALTADRPYRKAMPVAKALSIMRGMVGSAIDAQCFAALERKLPQDKDQAAA